MALRSVATLASLLVLSSVLGCDHKTSGSDAGPADAGPPVVRCGPIDDPDHDFISSGDEGGDDPDLDGVSNRFDTDSDGDGFPDADEAGDRDCSTLPIDTDADRIQDFLDRDANFDGIDDAEQGADDTDEDAILDRLDTDVDGDGIANRIEWGDGESPVDTDDDGTPDLLDRDSDADTIDDAHESAIDLDMDGDSNFRDLDSDGDGAPDSAEAGDGLRLTPPVGCAVEIDPTTGELQSDGRANFADTDSDNDGLGDGDEADVGSDPCDIDSDNDGVGDLAEGAYVKYNCPDGETGIDCDCAIDPSCQIPAEHFYVVLPYGGPPQPRDLEFGSTIRVADIFFVTDTTSSMQPTLDRVKATVAAPGTGLIDRISVDLDDAWFGGGQLEDFPFGSYGSVPDQPFNLAIRMTPPERSSDVQTAFNAMLRHNGADGPESQVEALFQILMGAGGTWMYLGNSYTMRRYAGDCLGGGWGAPCFRDSALAIVVLFTDICSHNGPPGESASCADYGAITPTPAHWDDVVAEMNLRGAKFVGINASTRFSCATTVGPIEDAPCYFLSETARATGSVDLDMNELVYDLPAGGASDTVFADTVVGAIQTVVTRVPFDLDTRVRDDPTDEAGVDARMFVKQRRPACTATPPAETCWVAPDGVAHEQAVAFVDDTTFYLVIPGTRVTFRLTFQNDTVPGGTSTQVFIAFIDVRSGTAVLDTRQVIVVVPADPSGPFG